jgi:hypothetical protein
MSKSTPAARISAVSSSASPGVSAYVPDLDKWPDSWMIDQPDRAMGKAIVTIMTPFIDYLIKRVLVIVERSAG